MSNLGTRMSNLGTFLTGAVFIGISWWGLTYVPVIQDMLPNIIVAPDPTITFVMSDQDAATLKMPSSRIDDACHDIPFLLRPIASRPLSVKVIFNYQQRDVGEAVYSCKADAHLIRSRQY